LRRFHFCLILPPAAMAARAQAAKKEPGFAVKVMRNKSLEQDSIRFPIVR
jgi:hypothetical protein